MAPLVHDTVEPAAKLVPAMVTGTALPVPATAVAGVRLVMVGVGRAEMVNGELALVWPAVVTVTEAEPEALNRFVGTLVVSEVPLT